MIYRSTRAKAWRDAMVGAINAGLEQGVFTLEPSNRPQLMVYEFTLGGVPSVASINEIGYDELSLHVALWPTPDARRYVQCWNAGHHAGEVFAAGWLERRDGPWLQKPPRLHIKARRDRLPIVAALAVEPRGYRDHGLFQF